MKERIHLGLNRTGIQMSPLQTRKMLETAEETNVSPLEDFATSEMVRLRSEYIEEAGTVGSIPPPATLTGLASTAVEAIQGVRPTVLIDKLGERLAFERTGARLYEAVITKCQAARADEILPNLRRIHQSELQHFYLLKNAIEEIGADPTVQTPCADINGVASMGLLQVANDPRTTVTQCLQMLLTAELVDNAAWDVLVDLARAANQDSMAESFIEALKAEEEHLATIRRIYRQWAFQDLGKPDRKTI